MFIKLGNPSRKNKAETVVIHDYDTWNMDITLAYIIVPMLKQLKETKHGAPFVHNEDVPMELHSTEEDQKDMHSGEDDKYFDRWDFVLNEMIFAFQSKLKDWEDQFCSGEVDWSLKKTDMKDKNGQPLFETVHGPKHTFEVDKEGIKKYQEKINNGFRLFGKYYNGLWD